MVKIRLSDTKNGLIIFGFTIARR